MPALFQRRNVVLPAVSAVAVLLVIAHGASAQTASGTITGRVLWGACVRAIPLPLPQVAQGQPGRPALPDTQVQGSGATVNGLPAGAVLVAVQNTAVSARTDETGRFSLSGAPAGQYLTVAAGPVADSVTATAERPNVFVSSGQSVDVGTLSLGGTPSIGLGCRVLPGINTPSPGAAPDTGPAQPADTGSATP